MRKEKLGAFFKGKGFYAALAVGTAAIFAVGILNTNMISDDNNELAKNPSSQIAENAEQEGREPENSIGDTTDFTSENEKLENGTLENSVLENNMLENGVMENEFSGNGTEGTSVETNEKTNGESTNSSEISSQESIEQELLKQETVGQEIAEQELIEEEMVGQEIAKTESVENSEMSDLIETTPMEVERIEKAEAEEKVAEVLSKESQVNSLNFSEEDGLLWPVQGNVILEYSMDKPIYFKTLAQYKCNSAIVIEAKEKTEVFSAAKCVITDISNVDETGITVKASIGNDYEVIYGQLSDVQVEVGDIVEAGAVIGTVGTPTKYYVEEGSNLYFKVLAGNEPINPLLLLN